MKKQRAFLKWAGGKYGLIESITQFLPTGKVLVEPFVGAGSVFLNTDYDAYLLADINPDLIALYNLLKTEPDAFIRLAKTLFCEENNQRERYFQLRDEFNQTRDVQWRSALFLYLNRHGYNGLCRYNSKGLFNVPFGRYKVPYFPEVEMQGFIDKSDRIELMCDDFEAALALAGNDDIVYCDPPYVPLSDTASFTTYASGGFDLHDQSRLAEVAKQVSEESKGVLISNHDTKFTREIYKEARLEAIDVQRNIAAKGSSRKKVGELLAIYGE